MEPNRGFTLIELVIAVAILGIAASLAVPAYLSWQDDSRAKGAAASMRADFERARMRAIRENANVRVAFNTDSYMVHTDQNGDNALDADEVMVLQRTLPAGVTLMNNFSDDDMSFSSRGIPAAGLSDAGTVTMNSAGGSTYSVIVSRFGRIRTQ